MPKIAVLAFALVVAAAPPAFAQWRLSESRDAMTDARERQLCRANEAGARLCLFVERAGDPLLFAAIDVPTTAPMPNRARAPMLRIDRTPAIDYSGPERVGPDLLLIRNLYLVRGRTAVWPIQGSEGAGFADPAGMAARLKAGRRVLVRLFAADGQSSDHEFALDGLAENLPRLHPALR